MGSWLPVLWLLCFTAEVGCLWGNVLLFIVFNVQRPFRDNYFTIVKFHRLVGL